MDEEHIFCQRGFDDVWRFGVNMVSEEEKDKDLERLIPCPFCGSGITEVGYLGFGLCFN